jgi:ABC-2 type transport system permease protein
VTRDAAPVGRATRERDGMPAPAQVAALLTRTLRITARQPFSAFTPLLISLFFLFIYQGQLGEAAGLFLEGQDYLGFILPLSIVSAAFSGSGLAGQTLVRDIETGYFDKLLLTPANRWAILLGPMLAAALVLVVQTFLLIGVAVAIGLEITTGAAGVATVLALTLLVGLGFGAFTTGVALLSGNAAATQSASFLFFPLSFLTATFVPIELLEGWLATAARLNPITYVLQAGRALINVGWDPAAVAEGLLAGGLLFAAFFVFTLVGLRVRTRRS